MTYGVVSTAGASLGSTAPLYNQQQAQRVERISGDLSRGSGVFVYRSTHAHGEIEATGFFTDGRRSGMRPGDLLWNVPYSTAGSSAATAHVVIGSTGAVAASDTAASSAYGQAYNASVSVAST